MPFYCLNLRRGHWSGNYLASAGAYHCQASDTLQHVLSNGGLVVTNFSPLGPKGEVPAPR